MSQVQNQGNGRGLLAVAGSLLFMKEAVFYVAFFILGTSIDWPGSLGLPAAEALPLIREHEGAVFTGYYFYLLSSIMYIPVALSLRALLRGNGTVRDLLLDCAVGLAVVSTAMRALGILRWLFAMPTLAAVYADPGSSPELLASVAVQFDVLNEYAGRAGEHLGVQLFATLFLGCFAAVMLSTRVAPKAFGVWLLLSSVLFIPWTELAGIDQGLMLTIDGLAYSLWAMVFGVYLILHSRRTTHEVSERAAL